MFVRKGERGDLIISKLTEKQYFKILHLFDDARYHTRGRFFRLPATLNQFRKLCQHFPKSLEVDPQIHKDIEAAKREYLHHKHNKDQIARDKKRYRNANIKHKWKIPPWEHQKRGFYLIIKNPALGLLWDMRTGKTMTVANAVQWLKNNGEPHKTLVICPTHIKTNWVEDVQKHTDLKSLILGTGTKKQVVALRRHDQITVVDGPHVYNRPGEPDLFITNHDAIRGSALLEALIEFNFDIIVVDESHAFKNPKAKRTKALAKLKKSIKRRYILTGTLVSRAPLDAYSQMKILNENIFTESFDEFGARYCIFRTHMGIRFFVRPKRAMMPELWRRINAYTDKVRIEDCHDMPKKLYTEVAVQLNAAERAAHNELRDELITYLDGDAVQATILTKAMKLIQTTSGFVYGEDGVVMRLPNPSKVEALKDILEQTVRQDRKIVIWAHYHETFRIISEVLDKEKIGYSMISGIDGRIKPEEKHKRIWRFKNDDKCPVIIANPSMIGIGEDLTVAMYAVYYENNYKLDLRAQSEARIYGDKSKQRHGDHVVIFDLIAINSIDRIVLSALKQRKDFLKFINAKKLKEL